MHNSSIYKELSKEEIKKVIYAHLNHEPFEYSLLTGGMFNTTYLITFSSNNKYVLSAGPINRHLLLPYENHMHAAEHFAYALCRKNGIPVPYVVACNTNKDIIDRDYMITEYVDSICLSSGGFTPDESSILHRELGHLARQFNDIKGDRFGRVYDVMNGRGFSTWADFLEDEGTEVAECMRSLNRVDDKILDRIKNLPVKYRDLLNEITTPRLIHTDLWDGNVLITPDKKRIAAIIDPDRAIFGDRAYEFACDWFDNDFKAAYGVDWHNDPKFIVRKKIYSSLYHLFESFVYFSEYNNEEKGNQTLKASINSAEGL